MIKHYIVLIVQQVIQVGTLSESRPKTSKKSSKKIENGKCVEEDDKKVNGNNNIKKPQLLTVATSKTVTTNNNNNNSQQTSKVDSENVRFRDNASIVSHTPISFAANSKTGRNGEQLKSTLCSIL